MAKRAKSEGPSKMSMVRDALEKLGDDAKPKAIHEYIQTHHGVDMKATMVSSYKSMLTRKDGSKKRGVGRGKGRSGSFSTAGGVTMDELLAVKQMVAKMGAEKLGEIVQLLTK